MILSTRVRYAVRLMIDIAQHDDRERPVPIREVAERQGLSKVYLSQLAIPLRNAALLRSVWGNKGGFVLGRPGSEIRVLDIVEAVDGPVCIIDCAVDPNYCNRSAGCEAIGLWRGLNEAIVAILAGQTLEELTARRRGANAPGVPGERKTKPVAIRERRGETLRIAASRVRSRQPGCKTWRSHDEEDSHSRR